MRVQWKPICMQCGKVGASLTYTDGGQPKHSAKMSGSCPKNPNGGHFGHSPMWTKVNQAFENPIDCSASLMFNIGVLFPIG